MMKTKNWMRTAIFAVLAAAATACTDNDLIDKDVNNTPDITDGKMTIYAASGDEAADTRVAYEDGTRTLKWQKEDRLAVVLTAKDGKVKEMATDFLFDGNDGDPSGSFTGTAINMVEGGMWNIYYPNTVKVNLDNGTATLPMTGQMQTANNNTEHLRNYILLEANIGDLNDGCKLEMKSSIMKFELKDVPAGVGELKNLVWMLETDKGTRSITLGFTPGTVKFDGSNTSLTAFLSFMPQDMKPKTDGKFTVILTGDKTYVAEGKVNTSYDAGKRYTAKIGEDIMKWEEKAIMALTVKVGGSNGLGFNIPFLTDGTSPTPAKLTVDWGDGTLPTEVASGTTLTAGDRFEHTYSTAGTYTITITSDQTDETNKQIPAFNFYRYRTDNNNMTKLISIDTPLLNMKPMNFNNCFRGCTALQNIPQGLFYKNTTATAFENCFYECTALKEIPQGLFNENTQVTSFRSCFYSCTALKEIPQGLFDKNTEATVFIACFQGCTHLALNSKIFSTNEDKSRFSGRMMYFENCFNNVGSALEKDKAGTAPDLWKYDGAENWSIYECFTNATKLKNYTIIPKSWGGSFDESVVTP